jgi:hypothetical protein
MKIFKGFDQSVTFQLNTLPVFACEEQNIRFHFNVQWMACSEAGVSLNWPSHTKFSTITDDDQVINHKRISSRSKSSLIQS